MSVTITFEKKHFLLMGAVIAIPFMFLAIMNIFAATPTGQYHTSDELYMTSNLDINNQNITNVSKIVFNDGNILSSSSGSVPSGMIGMFNTTCPIGWTRFAALDGRVPKGSVNYGAVGGSDTHTTPYSTRRATCSGGTCWYTSLQNSIGSASSWPPYLEVIWCQKN